MIGCHGRSARTVRDTVSLIAPQTNPDMPPDKLRASGRPVATQAARTPFISLIAGKRERQRFE